MQPGKASKKDLIPAQWQQALIVPGAFLVVMYLVQLVQAVMPAAGDAALVHFAGVEPRQVDGLVGVITSPFVHANWGHLFANTIPFLVFGFLLMVNGAKQFIAVTVLVWLIAGMGTWLTGDGNSVVIGASGVVFGWLAYLVTRGVFTRNFWQIVMGIVLLAIWGSIFWGVLPSANQVSWQAHLFGSIGGLVAAFLVSKADGPRTRKSAGTQAQSEGFGPAAA
ncbi:rhomboid family intramembrane serine protease [Nakamurella antarctica]|uniref:Rhomboid family intramembrane serine protease n=2 Tax=Nakamurella antarctica TaxID=1902245 RepID=A0A3G8ZRZ0_9ACTN|nr:rhomboid family intramembrane serine protease [Nakamurella antarctica]